MIRSCMLRLQGGSAVARGAPAYLWRGRGEIGPDAGGDKGPSSVMGFSMRVPHLDALEF
jgi:hypothetical protein